MAKKTETAQQRYEAKGKRPGKPISTRLNEEEQRGVDDKRGDTPAAAWLLALIRREIGINSPPREPRAKRKR